MAPYSPEIPNLSELAFFYTIYLETSPDFPSEWGL